MSYAQPSLLESASLGDDATSFVDAIKSFSWKGRPTQIEGTGAKWNDETVDVETFTNEFWTSKQRAANSLHEISYRACFKPQLVDFFVERLTRPGDLVYDPFMGRGTTIVAAALLDREVAGCDINPLSRVLTRPRLSPPTLRQVEERLDTVELVADDEPPADLTVFYHQDTLQDICGLRSYFRRRRADGALDDVDKWIEMVAVNRLTGHSPGFFSVYTMPPNQAVSVETQRKINARREQVPRRRDVRKIVLRKTRSLLKHCDDVVRLRLGAKAKSAKILTHPPTGHPNWSHRLSSL